MWSDNSHGQTFVQGQQAFIAGKAFTHGKNFQHSPALDRLCLHSRLGCVLAGGFHGKTEAGFLAQVQEAASVPSASEVSAEAAVFVAVIVVFYAAIIVILLGTNMRRPRSSSSSSSRQRRSRSRSRSRHRHQVVLDPKDGSVKTQHAPKKKKEPPTSSLQGAENV
ncbi:uncharacterized protein LOC125031592 [Penaeus chinensis]|uniref:uncharacterized protein LOC125031592 n=1 Tax=Penaeus chinensis TaxID=139456 RepID=UPI001FB69819|nr:uncharacterized protein LOC125031592 [Penaeus chinensis]